LCPIQELFVAVAAVLKKSSLPDFDWFEIPSQQDKRWNVRAEAGLWQRREEILKR
jgi:hypothetical protein